MASSKSRTLLLDADIFCYQASAATEGVWYFDGKDNPPCVDADLDAALAMVDARIEAVANKLKASRLIVCLTDSHNFRKDVWPLYKANRSGSRKPTFLNETKAHLAEKYETYQRPGLEADDCMGILSTHKSLVPGEKIIVSTDKDMGTIPGLLFNPDKDKEPRRISKQDADRKFMSQVLTGDATDGYPGCPGIGPKKADAILNKGNPSVASMWASVLTAYASKGLTERDALVQARMARILRAEDWDFQKKAPRLWCPPRLTKPHTTG